MSILQANLEERMAAENRPLDSLLRQHVLDGLLRRLAHSPHAGAFLLRGGLLTRAWLGAERRTTDDADFLAQFPRDLDESLERMHSVAQTPLPEEDDVQFLLGTLAGLIIWEETPFPGIRLSISARACDATFDLQIDVGFGDPVIPPPVWLDYPTLLAGATCRVLTCRPETLIGWKLHGLFEHGARRWRAKDLHDLLLLLTFLPCDLSDLTEAIRTAFVSRDCPLTEIPGVLYNRGWWTDQKAIRRWEKFRETPAGARAATDLLQVAGGVAGRLRRALEALIKVPEAEEWEGSASS